MEHFNNIADTKEDTDRQKLKKTQMDCDMRLSSFKQDLKNTRPGRIFFCNEAIVLLFWSLEADAS